jgi:hypothetical protein
VAFLGFGFALFAGQARVRGSFSHLLHHDRWLQRGPD